MAATQEEARRTVVAEALSWLDGCVEELDVAIEKVLSLEEVHGYEKDHQILQVIRLIRSVQHSLRHANEQAVDQARRS